MGTRDDDFLEALFSASTHSYILVFTNLGLLHWLKVYFIPDAGTTGRGKNIVNLVNLQPNEKVQAFLPVREFVEGRYVVMATRKGVIKKCSLSVFDRPTSRGIIALNLDEDDELISARLTEGEDQVLIATYKGKAIRFPESGVRPMGRPARGVRSIKLGKDDRVIGMVAVNQDVLSLSVTENGYGKRTKISEYREQSRGGKGVINIKTTAKNGNVVAVLDVTVDPDIMIITRGGKIIRIGSDKIRKTARSAQGVRLVNVEPGDEIAAACIIQDNGEDEEGGDGANGQQPLLQ